MGEISLKKWYSINSFQKSYVLYIGRWRFFKFAIFTLPVGSTLKQLYFVANFRAKLTVFLLTIKMCMLFSGLHWFHVCI